MGQPSCHEKKKKKKRTRPLIKSAAENIRVSKAGVVAEAVVVRLVLHDGVRRQVEEAAEGALDAGRRGRVAGRLVPNGDDVLLEADGDDDAADLLADHELLAEHGHAEDLPVAGREALAEAHDPLAAVLVGLVLHPAVKNKEHRLESLNLVTKSKN